MYGIVVPDEAADEADDDGGPRQGVRWGCGGIVAGSETGATRLGPAGLTEGKNCRERKESEV
jgi:hypothetical protein